MGLFGKLKNQMNSSEMKSKKSHIKNMYAVALCDGDLHNNEFDFILHTGINKLYLDGKSVQEIVNNSEDIQFHIPNTHNERISHLEDYVKISMIDGDINPNEINLCKRLATSYGFRPVVIDKMFNMFIGAMAEGIAKDLALAHALQELEE